MLNAQQRLIKSLKNLCNKVTGKKSTKDSVTGVIDDIATNYTGGSGTTVVANPELVGTEPNLTGLEVSGTKYKVPEGGSANLGLKYQDTRDVVDFVYTDIHAKLGDTANIIELDTSKLKQILAKAGVDLNKTFQDSGESSDSGMGEVRFMFKVSYTSYDNNADHLLFKSYALRIFVYYSYGELHEIRLMDKDGNEISKIDLTGVIGLTTWENLLDWMIENNQNLTIGKAEQGSEMRYWGNDMYLDFGQEYNWATYPTFSTVYINNFDDDIYREEPLYVDIQDLKDTLIYK